MQTLGDLRDSFNLYAVCVPCRRMEPVDLDRLALEVGDDLPLPALRARLCCTACGTRTRDVRIVYVGPQDRTTAFRYRR